MKKIMIVAPFWLQDDHVGVKRIDRIVRWCNANDIEVILITAGRYDRMAKTTWGMKIEVKDPIGFYILNKHGKPEIKSLKKFGFFGGAIKFMVHFILAPDLGVVWSRRVVRNYYVTKYGQGSSWVFSSSPPESTHIAAASLAKKVSAKLIVDLRDGWLDEPLKPILRSSVIQHWRESRLEKKVLVQADKIFVTSVVWRSFLEHRLPFTKGKTVVLTNGFPDIVLGDSAQKINSENSCTLRLVHAGRFTGSSSTRKISLLLEPLIQALNSLSVTGKIIFLGKLEKSDLIEAGLLKKKFESKGWVIDNKTPVPYALLHASLREMDGLLLLSSSMAALPSKFFDYLLVRRPILAVTRNKSALWEICQSLPQVFLVDYQQVNVDTVTSFIEACQEKNCNYPVPDQFSEKSLSNIFIKELQD